MFHAKHVVIVLPERLGDTLFNTPAIEFMKYYYPSCTLDAICLTSVSADVIANNPHISRIYIAPTRRVCERIQKMIDYALFLSDYEHGLDKYMTYLKPKLLVLKNISLQAHLAAQKLKFMADLTGKTILPAFQQYFLYPSGTETASMKQSLHAHQLDPDQQVLIGLHLGCHRIARRHPWRLGGARFTHKKVWPLAHFIELARALSEKNPHIRFVVTGTKSEVAIVKRFCRQVPAAVNFANQTTVLEAAALMKFLQLYIACDTGTTHLAYAMKIPTVVLFGPTNLALTGPYPPSEIHHVISHKTIDEIPVAQVLSACETALQQTHMKEDAVK